jgi:hypothetical protein
MARPMQISPPRVNSEVHAWLMDMSTTTGLTISTLVGEILDRARVKGWTVEPMRVTEPDEGRPGRRVVVVADLADLRGPLLGPVELPLQVFWSLPDRTFDLDDRDQRRSMYEVVLTEAVHLDTVTAYLNRGILQALWPDLRLGKAVRQAWEARHPVLRGAKAA